MHPRSAASPPADSCTGTLDESSSTVIGVAAEEADLPWVMEFFELFKTPWEPVSPGKRYRVVLSTSRTADIFDADVTLVYGADELPVDRRFGATVTPRPGPVEAEWNGDADSNGDRVPLYGRVASFAGELETGQMRAGEATVGYRRSCGTKTIHRFGYDLFAETAALLTSGQPTAQASSPALELHIDIIRQCVLQAHIPLVEIPPRPAGYSFVCCLTHDVDFFGIRRHAGDSTLAGFIGRATAGSAFEVLRGRRRIDEAIRNWASVASLPMVFLGRARDFWQPFDDYRRVERGRHSTFFLIPFKGRPGVGPDGKSRSLRGAPYGVAEIRQDIADNSGPTTEFAVHGIDAWRDTDLGRAEREELAKATGHEQPGVRMHWLYFSQDSGRKLEDAGFAYDSTWGYNDAVGYRAGTAQAFQLRGTRQFLELPLTIMDTALFYLDRMGLTRRQAMNRCRLIIQQLRRFGGALVVNWHDRSLAPERQWARPYEALLNELDANGVWFAKAGEAVEWFQWRRAIRFVATTSDVHVTAPASPQLPGARIVVHRPTGAGMHTEEQTFLGGAHTVRV